MSSVRPGLVLADSRLESEANAYLQRRLALFYGITFAAGVPTVLNMLLTRPLAYRAEDVPTLRLMTCSTAPLTLEQWLRRTGEGIRLSPVPTITSSGRLPPGAPPLEGAAFMTSALVLLVLAASALAGTLIWAFSVGKLQFLGISP